MVHGIRSFRVKETSYEVDEDISDRIIRWARTPKFAYGYMRGQLYRVDPSGNIERGEIQSSDTKPLKSMNIEDGFAFIDDFDGEGDIQGIYSFRSRSGAPTSAICVVADQTTLDFTDIVMEECASESGVAFVVEDDGDVTGCMRFEGVRKFNPLTDYVFRGKTFAVLITFKEDMLLAYTAVDYAPEKTSLKSCFPFNKNVERAKKSYEGDGEGSSEDSQADDDDDDDGVELLPLEIIDEIDNDWVTTATLGFYARYQNVPERLVDEGNAIILYGIYLVAKHVGNANLATACLHYMFRAQINFPSELITDIMDKDSTIMGDNDNPHSQGFLKGYADTEDKPNLVATEYFDT